MSEGHKDEETTEYTPKKKKKKARIWEQRLCGVPALAGLAQDVPVQTLGNQIFL